MRCCSFYSSELLAFAVTPQVGLAADMVEHIRCEGDSAAEWAAEQEARLTDDLDSRLRAHRCGILGLLEASRSFHQKNSV